MKCSRCATDIPETSPVCPNCGAQRNVDPISTFSYLPPGTPPWPTSVPQNMPQQTLAATQPVGQIVPAQPVTKQKKRPTTSSIVSSLSVLVLSPLVGAAIVFALLYNQGYFTSHTTATSNSQAPQATAAPATSGSSSSSGTNGSSSTGAGNSSSQSGTVPAPKAFKDASDKNVNVALRYPSDWSLNKPDQTQNSSALLLEQDSIGIDLIVQHFTESFSSSISSAQELNQAYIQNLSQYQGIQDIQTVKSDTPSQNIGGDKWQRSEATFVDGQGTKQHFITIAVQHSKSYYGINILVPDNLYKDASNKYFTPIFNSLKFLS